MPSYLVNGASRGLGWEFISQLSSDPKNTVIGVVRNKAGTEKEVAKELSGRSNLFILEASLTDYDSMKRMASEAAAITGGTLDYLIANGAFLSTWEAQWAIGDLAASEPQKLAENFHEAMNTNVLGNVYLISLLMPQILKSDIKKVAVITTGHADLSLVRRYEVTASPVYATSKAAVNLMVGKFHAQYKKDGVLFLSVSPGAVATANLVNADDGFKESLVDMFKKFQMYSPEFTGPLTPEESVKAVLGVIERSSVHTRDGGAFLSHFGNDTWL